MNLKVPLSGFTKHLFVNPTSFLCTIGYNLCCLFIPKSTESAQSLHLLLYFPSPLHFLLFDHCSVLLNGLSLTRFPKRRSDHRIPTSFSSSSFSTNTALQPLCYKEKDNRFDHGPGPAICHQGYPPIIFSVSLL